LVDGEQAHGGGKTMWAYFDNRARRMGILDTKLIQAAAIFFALAIVKLFPQIMTVNIWWFIVLAIVCAIKPIITFYGKSAESSRKSN
jgi:hypothetical protein